MLQKIRYILFPFTIIFYAIVSIKNWLYDVNFLKTKSYSIKLINVGNLRVGGTGKTPFIIYLLNNIFNTSQVAVLSKGYKRSTKGIKEINPQNDSAQNVGDEAFILAQKFPQHKHCVCNNKQQGLETLLQNNLDYVILDDSFHHRELAFHKNILLTDFKSMYYDDWMLPMGNLREYKATAKRADVIVVTKCDANLSSTDAQNIKNLINPFKHQQVFFTSMLYENLQYLFKAKEFKIDTIKNKKIVAIHGIAQGAYFIDYLNQYFIIVININFNDHHIYTLNDVRRIQNIANENIDYVFISTEKDAVKLKQFEQYLKTIPIYILPMRFNFLFGEERKFKDWILN